MDSNSRPARDEEVARVAGRQRGLITWEQLGEVGYSRSAVSRAVAAGRLHRVHRGVYLVGHPVAPRFAAELAALLACGPAAVLSHHTAAALWRILPTVTGRLEVTVPGRRCRPQPGLVPHAGTLADHEITERHGLRLTTPARTLHDLLPLLDRPAHERATDEAEVLHLIPPHRESPGITRSEGERRLNALLRRAGLKATRTNVTVAGHEVDALFAPERLVVEMDGYAFHRTRAAFERDRRRDADLLAAGYRVARVTWRQLTEEPEAVAARLGATLARTGLRESENG